MMIVAAWIVYCLMITVALTLGAAAWERAAGWSGRAARWGWLSALGASVALPWLLPLLPERSWVEAMPAARALRLDAIEPVAASSAGTGWTATEVGVALWLAASVVVLGYVVLLLGRLAYASRRWREAELEGGRVLLTRTVGPAAVGVRRGVVVLPAWVMELDAELRSLLLRHEREHVHAGDPRLLVTGLVLLAAMPWNPMVWYQVLRLRNAIELDCDARVLSAGADPERYGSLLLEVGRRRSRHVLVMATFAEPRVFLEQRIRRIAHWPLERSRGRAALFATMAAGLFVASLSCADPVRVQGPSDLPREMADRPTMMPGQSIDEKPVFTPMTRAPELVNRDAVREALERNYPPLLREAGIGGSPTVFFFIDADGVVRKTLLSKSSGYDALDAAALNVASTMEFEPGYNRDAPVAVWVEIPIVFTLPRQPAPAGTPVQDVEPGPERVPLPAPPRPLGRIDEEPVFTPMTEAPELLNRAEVGAAMAAAYPPLLRDAGIGGSTVVSFFIDETGAVQKVLVSKSSGYPALDQAALAVGRAMRFKPAKNRTRDVAVWVEIPVVFTPR